MSPFEFVVKVSATIDPCTVKVPPVVRFPVIVWFPSVVISSVVNVPVTSVEACNEIVPEPPGFKDKIAFDDVAISESLIVMLSIVTVPVIEATLIVGEVKTLFVSVCESVRVTTVPVSIACVTVLLLTDVLMPVPPAKCKVSESKSMDNTVESSALKSKSCAVTCAST